MSATLPVCPEAQLDNIYIAIMNTTLVYPQAKYIIIGWWLWIFNDNNNYDKKVNDNDNNNNNNDNDNNNYDDNDNNNTDIKNSEEEENLHLDIFLITLCNGNFWSKTVLLNLQRSCLLGDIFNFRFIKEQIN